jgi:hypothetical protein
MPETLHLNLTGGRPNQAVINLCAMAKLALEMGMVQAGFHGDPDAAIATFMRGADTVVTPLEHVLPRTHLATGGQELRAAHFFHPFFCCLLAGDWEAMQKVVAMLHGTTLCPDETLFDGLMRIYGALATNDRAGYELARAWARRKLEHPDVTFHKLHARIADAVMEADQAVLDGLVAEAIASFPARGKRRTPSLLYGMGRDDNLLVLDFIAVGLAKIASKRGLAVEADSPVMPRALTTWWRQ